jgi:hypothetical protein
MGEPLLDWSLGEGGTGGTGERDWDVYAPSGACLGTVRMPDGLTVFEIGEDYVLGKTAAQSDAERVQLHRLSGR